MADRPAHTHAPGGAEDPDEVFDVLGFLIMAFFGLSSFWAFLLGFLVQSVSQLFHGPAPRSPDNETRHRLGLSC